MLRAGGAVVHVKRRRGRRPSAEAAAIRAAEAAGVSVARIAFEGIDRREGSVVGTYDLAPARPVADLLRARLLDDAGLTAALEGAVRAAAALHAAHFEHHDLYLDHVFVDPARPGAVTVIDLERLSVQRTVLGRGVVKDLAALESSLPEGVLSCRARSRFVSRYLHARGFPIRRLRGPLARRVATKAARIRAHPPKTPVGDAARPS